MVPCTAQQKTARTTKRVRFASNTSVRFIDATGFDEELWRTMRLLHKGAEKGPQDDDERTPTSIFEVYFQMDSRDVSLYAPLSETIEDASRSEEEDRDAINKAVETMKSCLEATSARGGKQCRNIQEGYDLTNEDMLHVLFRGLMSTKEPHKSVEQHTSWLNTFLQYTPQIVILCALEEAIAASSNPTRSAIRSPLVVQALYEADILKETVLLPWGTRVLDAEFVHVVTPELHQKIVAANKIFVDWLMESDEESDEE